MKCLGGSIEEVFAPLRFALAEHADQMPAGVQAEGARLARQFHPGFLGCPAAFTVVAWMATGDQIFPSRFSGARSGNDVVQRQLGRSDGAVAVLAGVAVAH